MKRVLENSHKIVLFIIKLKKLKKEDIIERLKSVSGCSGKIEP